MSYVGSDQGYRCDEFRPVGREQARYAIAECMSCDESRPAAFGLDRRGDVTRAVLQVAIRAAVALPDPARLGPQNAKACPRHAFRDRIKIARATAK